MSDAGHRRGSERRPIALQVRLAFEDLDEFVERYAINISDGGIFIRSREPRPVGSRLKFELRLRTGEVVFEGEGTVRWRQLPDARGLNVAGMGLQFDHLTDESRQVLNQILDLREGDQAPPPVEGASPESWRPLEEFPPPVDPVPEVTPVTTPPVVAPALTKQPERTIPPPQAQASFGQPLARMQLVSKGVVLGIDVGWSSIRVATAQGERGVPIPLGSAGAFPAVVAGLRDGWCIGAEAVEALARGAQPFRGIAALIGRWPESPAAKIWKRRQMGELTPGPDGRLAVRIGGELASPQTILTAQLQAVSEAVQAKLRAPITKVTFAVPAGWSDAQRRALRQAAEAAGLPVDQLVNASVAAALACHGVRGQRRLLAIHFGEGSFEAGIVEQAGHVFDLVGSACESGIGGADLDAALLEALLTQFEAETGYLIPEDPAVFERVRAAATQAKEKLADALDCEVYLSNLVEAGLSRADLQQRVTRARLLQLAGPMLDQAVEVTRSAMQARSLGGADLDEILLFGGQSRLGALARKLAEKLGREPVRPDSADDAPAVGAALIAEGAKQLGRHVVAGAVGASVLIGLPGGGVRRIIERNLPLPVERGYTIATGFDAQREIELFLFQGEKQRAFENEYLGSLSIGPLTPLPKGEVRVALTLALNEAGELAARGRDVATGRPVHVAFNRDASPEMARKALLSNA